MRTKLKIFRVLQRLSQQAIAGKLGYKHAYYGQVERGVQSGSAEFWARLQAAFQLTDEQIKELKQID